MLYIKGLRKDYKNFSLDCTMQVEKGRITGLIGQNGAGKSTTFKAILGLISCDGGSITVLGKNHSELAIEDKKNIGVVLSDSGFSGYLTIKELIPVLKAMYEKFDAKRFSGKIAQFGLPMDKKLKDFSTGMQGKLKCLIATSFCAKFLILDEPTAGLDVLARDEILSMLRDYMEEDEERAILISSHISSDLEALCDDLYMIHDGRIIFHEDTDVLLGEYLMLKVAEEQWDALDKNYILATKKEPYGYRCLTNQGRFYQENYPEVVVEKASIDSMIETLIKGERK